MSIPRPLKFDPYTCNLHGYFRDNVGPDETEVLVGYDPDYQVGEVIINEIIHVERSAWSNTVVLFTNEERQALGTAELDRLHERAEEIARETLDWEPPGDKVEFHRDTWRAF